MLFVNVCCIQLKQRYVRYGGNLAILNEWLLVTHGAIKLGGPAAIFWIWVMAILGMTPKGGCILIPVSIVRFIPTSKPDQLCQVDKIL